MENTFLSSVLLIIFHLSMATFSMNLTSILTDQSALLALKDSVAHDSKNILATNWSASTPVCNWFGVSCGSRHHRVTTLNLSGLELTGTLPPHMGNLSFLSFLSIKDNSIHGGLPVQLSNLHRLKHIDFGNNSFTGEIPSWFGSLTELQELYLHVNNFSGVIPSSLGYLPKLEKLSLYENQISGSIPSSIFNMSSLQGIDLSNNMLSGPIPFIKLDLVSLEFINFNYNNLTGLFPKDMFDHLPNLKTLYLSGNMLFGRIPSSLFNCKKLQTLFLSTNQLEGSLPAVIENLSMLQSLDISHNHFEGQIPEQIANLTLLREFDGSHNNFTGTIPQLIGNLKNLEFLSLGVNNLVGPIPPEIFNSSSLQVISLLLNQLSGRLPSNMGLWLPNLEYLLLGSNQLSGSFPMFISNASQLIFLDMPHNYFSDSIPDTLGNLRNLKKLNLEVNNLTSSGLSFLSSLTNCRGLEVVDFGNNPSISGKLPGLVGNLSNTLLRFFAARCNISGSIPSQFGNLSRLIAIKLDDNKLTGTVPTAIGGLKELQSLSLSGNKLEGPIPSELCRLNKLAFLFLTNNKLSAPVPTCLGDLVSLRQLLLGSNMFSGSIPSTLMGLNDLLILNLSSNYLTGPLPIDIGKWKVVNSLDLSNNQFSGDIPIRIADLKDLTYFSLSDNRITGSIPESFGELLSLESLDLSRNNLSGEIPKSLDKLHYLKYFNVSFNRLQGEIPDGGPFGSYSIESFKGNDALCGADRLHVPRCKTKPLGNSKARTKLIIYVALPIASIILVVALTIIILRRSKRKGTSETPQDLLPLGMWRQFSYQELHQATDGFSKSKLLGTGSYGSVYRGTLLDGITFAIKVFKLELKGAFKSFDVECEVLRNIRHRNLTKIISMCSNNLDFGALILELMPNGSLDKWLYSNNHFLDILQRLNILIDVASALEHLHHHHTTPVVHCDLKPSNILLDENMVAHLSDFGIAKLLCEEDSMIQTMTLATIGYMAPEYGSEGIVSTKGDVYSFGILTMETITRKKPTDEMFAAEMSLRSYVKESLPSMVHQVGDTESGRKHLADNNCASSICRLP
ncbi:putative Leucine-rich repeat protein kinase family protein [Hibiscus syriacus]|uniref:non-specific serine/threonine protein kinase n=1 Tax=Hibiscus syriacus TaxID=106335 RepID=A0A6A3CWY9_HIBSY|nr:LRR receptor-like serine/threonine-protein kinase EFR [Hibiscus syriacus]KAE8731741.1 putative Leucine-rich repeat protein kinase family protein [Hibiscus syriacus]